MPWIPASTSPQPVSHVPTYRFPYFQRRPGQTTLGKAEREENLKDAAKLADLADELKEALEKEDRFVFSLNTVKKTEEIEKLARKIRARMAHESGTSPLDTAQSPGP